MGARRHFVRAKLALFRTPANDPVVWDRAELVNAFHRLYYESAETTWAQTTWRGHRVLKCPLDLWVYQEILVETQPDLIVETGTFGGGSAYYLAGICDLLGRGEIVTIDVDPQEELPEHERIAYVTGSSDEDDVLADVRRRVARAERVMVILDSDHRYDHVLRESQLYSRFVTPGCYLVVEDTNVNGHPVAPDLRPGPDGGAHRVSCRDRRLRGRSLAREALADLQPVRLPP